MNVERYVMRRVRRQGYRNFRRSSIVRNKRNVKIELAKKRTAVTRDGYSQGSNEAIGVIALIFFIGLIVMLIKVI